jgi:hypothetical protein
MLLIQLGITYQALEPGILNNCRQFENLKLSKCLNTLLLFFKVMRYTEIESIDERIKERMRAVRGIKYFEMRELNECNKLIPQVEKAVRDYKRALTPWYKTSWYDAENNAFKAFITAASKAGRDEAYFLVTKDVRMAVLQDTLNALINIVKKATLDYDPHEAWYVAKSVFRTLWNPMRSAANDVATDIGRMVGWEVMRDIKGYENNPFEKLFKIYELGLYPRGFCEVDGSEKFIVDFPLKTYELGCWAEGDREISYKHKWNEDCEDAKPMKPLRKIE